MSVVARLGMLLGERGLVRMLESTRRAVASHLQLVVSMCDVELMLLDVTNFQE